MLHRAEERDRVLRHYERRSELERQQERAAQAVREKEYSRKLERAAAASERDQRHRLQLAKLRFEQQQHRQRAERERRVAYFARLGPTTREARLEHCLRGPAGACDRVLSALLDAAQSEAERNALVRRFEAALRDHDGEVRGAHSAANATAARSGMSEARRSLEPPT